MKWPAMGYARVESLDELWRALDAAGPEAQILAGGQSLLATLAFRLSAPSTLIDITRIAALKGVSVAGNVLRIGALTRHADLARDPLVARHAPMLAEAAPLIAHPAIRNRGTIGGSLALADPAAELPACVVALDGGIGKGSGRSVPGVGLGGAILAARQAGLLIAGGGHPMAAGFTVAEDKLDAFRAFLDERIAGEIEAKGVVPELRLDGALALAGANWDLVQSLEALAPFGQGNAEPVFALPDVRIAKSDVVGRNHVRCFVTGPAGGRLKAIAFRALETPLGNALLDISGAPLHLAGRLRPDTWQGREDVQLVIADAAKVQ